MDYESLNSWKENLSIYKENLSVYYIISILLSFFSVVFTWWYHKYFVRPSGNETSLIDSNAQDNEDDTVKEKHEKDVMIQPTELGELEIVQKCSKEGLQGDQLLNHLILTHQANHGISSKLSQQQQPQDLAEEQLKENEVVQSQKAEIYKLVLDNKDKYKMDSVVELEKQMKLYL